MNRNFAKRYDKGRFEFAPSTLTEADGRVILKPTVEQYRAAGWRLYFQPRQPKKAPDGRHWEQDGWEETPAAFTPKWKLVKDAAPTVEDFDAAMESHLREEREARGYTTREPDVYLTSEEPRWAQDARDWIAHRDAVMRYALELMNAVAAGERKPPTMDEFINGLPKITWTIAEES